MQNRDEIFFSILRAPYYLVNVNTAVQYLQNWFNSVVVPTRFPLAFLAWPGSPDDPSIAGW
jgi:hypothetical protein